MPRSPSRDVVDRFTGNRGYFHRADPLHRWKNLGVIGAAFLVAGWLVVEFAMPGRAANVHTHGELANPHAAFDSDCQACHVKHGLGDMLSNPLSLFRPRDRWHDLTCTKCHAGPTHHTGMNGEGKEFHDRCSNCHHDHNGRGFSLVKMDDSHCVKCHADLPAAHESGASGFAKRVTGFATDHPEFRSLKIDRGLKFSHGLHMTAGLVYSENDQHKWTPESLGKRFGSDARTRYRSESGRLTDPVQLQCSSCHSLDAEPRSEGAYYRPVNYEASCKVCHPIQSPSTASAGVAIPEFAIPHGRQTAALKPLVRGELANRLASGKYPLLALPFGPGKRLDPAASTELGTFGKDLDRLTNASLQAVGVACGKCHYSSEAVKTDVRPLPNKSVWFEHAKFNHVSHRSLTCGSCHPGTEASFTLNEREPALIAGLKSCQTCHSPTSAGGAGIRHSCVDCHRYHNGDHPLQGLGSPHRDPVKPLNLEQFLNGGKNSP